MVFWNVSAGCVGLSVMRPCSWDTISGGYAQVFSAGLLFVGQLKFLLLGTSVGKDNSALPSVYVQNRSPSRSFLGRTLGALSLQVVISDTCSWALACSLSCAHPGKGLLASEQS